MSENKKLFKVSTFCRDFLSKTTVILRFCTLSREQLKDYFEKPRINVPIYEKPERIYWVKNSKDFINLDEYDKMFHDEIVDFTKEIYDKLNYEQYCEIENVNTLILLFSEFDNYFFKCFKYILTKRPSILNDQKITIKELIEKQGDINLIIEDIAEKNALRKFNLDILLDDIIEKKIHNKFYKVYDEVFKYAKNTLTINHNLSDDLIKSLDFYKQIRNIYAHGDGTITRIFRNKIKKISSNINLNNFQLGNKFIVKDHVLTDIDFILTSITAKFDKALLKKYPELLFKEDKKISKYG